MSSDTPVPSRNRTVWAAFAAVAAGLGVAAGLMGSGVVSTLLDRFWELWGPRRGLFLAWSAVYSALVTLLPILVAVVVFHVLVHSSRPGPQGELRCLKCGGILKGLQEPRCPACGQAI